MGADKAIFLPVRRVFPVPMRDALRTASRPGGLFYRTDLNLFGSRRSRTTVSYRVRARRGTGPRPTVEGGRFFTVARGPVPRDRWITRTMARDRPSPYGKTGRFFTVDPFGSGRSRTTVFYRIRARRGTGPRPTVTRSVFFRSARERTDLSPAIVGPPFCRSRSPDLDPFGSRRS